ncbi:MAG: trypsin-like peptidase domain-containing protein [Oscillospiraceae bacterium]|nr:trypsin-like peptidase domain-containing protein [Oscillospiraceae bacterium]
MRKSTRYISILITAIMLLAPILLSSVSEAAPGTSSVLDTRTLALINKPGTVLVLTTWTADMRLHEFSLDDSMVDDLIVVVTDMIEKGEIANDEATIYSVIIQLIAMYMHEYAFYNGNVTNLSVSLEGIGSGFIVTPDGYLVTNAHVVQGNEDELYRYFAITNLQQQAENDIMEMLADLRRMGYQPTGAELQALYDAYFNLLAQSFELSNMQSTFHCVLGNVTPGSDISVRGISMDLRKIGEPYPGKDIAILKINGQNNLPTVTLGDDESMKTGDRVYAMGYPGAATLHDSININQSLQEPTLTQGIISARKQMDGGWGVLQMDAAIHYGNSGGPLFNEFGEVIGVNTFGSVDDSSGSLVGGMNFAIPINIARQFLNEINVTPSESTFTTNFKKALTAYQDGEYDVAVETLRAINDTNPGFPVVQELLADSRRGLDAMPQTTTTAAAASVAQATDSADDSDDGEDDDADDVEDSASSRTTTASGGGRDSDSANGASSRDGGGNSSSGSGASSGSNTILGIHVAVFFGGIVLIVLAVAAVLIVFMRKGAAPAAQASVVAAPAPQAIQQPTAATQLTYESPPAAVDAPLVCAHCGRALVSGAMFCDGCGQAVPPPAAAPAAAPQQMFCPQCGAQLNQDSAFCNKCGFRLA